MNYKSYGNMKYSGSDLIGDIPSHWATKRVRFLINLLVSNVDKKSEDDELPVFLCNYTDVYYNDFINNEMEFMEASATIEEVKKFLIQPDDVIITKDSESWDDIAKPAYVLSSNSNLICGYHLAILRSNKKELLGKYLLRCLQARGINEQFQIRASGVTRYGIPRNGILDCLLIVPSIDEQQMISNFLDFETSRIDILIERKRELIIKLQEKRTSLIHRCVTKGLNQIIQLKNSGFDWLGMVPQHWIVKKIKWHTPVLRGASPRPIDNPIYFDDEGEYSWVRISDVTASGMYLEKTEQKLSDLGASLSVKLEPGQLFLSIAATVGKPCISRIKCCIHDGFVWFPHLKMNIKFLYYIFICGEPYKGLGKFGTQLNLNTETVGSISIAEPPLEEQEEIVDYLDSETGKIDNLIYTVEKAIKHLLEYRVAVITAAVIGKISVLK